MDLAASAIILLVTVSGKCEFLADERHLNVYSYMICSSFETDCYPGLYIAIAEVCLTSSCDAKTGPD